MTGPFFDAQLDLEPIELESGHLKALCDRLDSQGWPSDSQLKWEAVNAMSSAIEKCYSGMERILKNILQELDGSIPNSQDWHKQLIARAAHASPLGRPPLLDQALSNQLHDLRAFRHRERNSYVADLDADLVMGKAKLVSDVVSAFKQCIAAHLLTAENITQNDTPTNRPGRPET